MRGLQLLFFFAIFTPPNIELLSIFQKGDDLWTNLKVLKMQT